MPGWSAITSCVCPTPNAAAVAAQIPALERAVAQTEAALAVLAGRSARAVYTPTITRGTDLETLQLGPEVPAGLPADLLARRPDIRQAEASLVAADFRISEARAQYFPILDPDRRFRQRKQRLVRLVHLAGTRLVNWPQSVAADFQRGAHRRAGRCSDFTPATG